jgi:nitrate/TMAO reductase-like tetraheme cytochrome c subunit
MFPAMRRGALVLVAVLGGVVALPLGWSVSDHLERNNDFCNGCHVEPDRPLHREIRREFDADSPRTLAGAHGSAHVWDRDDPSFRCIDCHGGASLSGRARVKTLAAIDAFWYVTGRFEEPRHMDWPLRDEDCVKCHPTFDADEALAQGSQRFHSLAVHNVDLAVRCVECHRVHEPARSADTHFLHADLVRGQCARCHPEFQEDPT